MLANLGTIPIVLSRMTSEFTRMIPIHRCTDISISIYLYNYSPCAHNPIQKHQSRSSARYHWDEEQQHFAKQIGA